MKTGKHFKPQSAATRKFINGRIKEGYTQEDFIRVIDLKAKQWLNRHEFSAFLRPSTLFNATNFENYVNELVVSKKPKRQLLVAPCSISTEVMSKLGTWYVIPFTIQYVILSDHPLAMECQ
ncbi:MULTISPECIES: conserved phage C-terminal domain-containing protein [unclassified Sporosarcina]|uniref:conserved phage C-terminal domain-containing protein n=1 Tax=unclassified Sporosarcina TaxID=2647733 RepID=UPI0013046C5D|nr:MULTISPECIES: conserved phage C-terminal domain-containing protein [unclassified Sporosarcina]